MSTTTPSLKGKETRPLFITPLMRRDYGNCEQMNQGLTELLLGLEKTDRNNAPNTSNLGGFHTGVGFLDRKDPPVEQLKKLIFEGVADFTKEFVRTNCSGNPQGIQVRIWGWGIIMRAGDSNFQHVHPDAKISGVYYATVPNDANLPPVGNPEGALMFVDPRPRAHMNRIPKQATEFIVDPVPGMMVLFPSYFEHGVVPFRGPGIRVCIAFNAQIDEGPVPRPQQP